MNPADPPESRAAHPPGCAAFEHREFDENPVKYLASVNSAFSCGVEGGTLVPIVDGVLGTEFDDPAGCEAAMTDDEAKALAVKRAAVLIFLKIDTRSLRTIAGELNVTPAALSKVWRQLLFRTGSALLYTKAEKRAKLAAAARRTLNATKRVVAT